MANTPYEKLYENILPKFKDYEIPFMTEEEAKETLWAYITPAVARFHVCEKDLSDRDDENECFNSELSESEIEILANFLLLEYLDSNYIRTPTLLKATLSSSDFNAFSNGNMLGKLTAMHDMYRTENETLLSRYAWIDNDEPYKKLKSIAGRKITESW